MQEMEIGGGYCYSSTFLSVLTILICSQVTLKICKTMFLLYCSISHLMDIGAHSMQGDNTARKCLETYIQMLCAFLKWYINGINTRGEVRDHLA